MGALRIACNGLCTAARFHTAEENPGCLLERHEGLDCLRHCNQCLTLFRSPLAFWPGTGEYISRTSISNDFLFKNGTRSDRLCILVSGLLDAFFTAFKWQRTHKGHGLNFKELMYGRIKMMTALCLAWARTHQTMCLEFSPQQFRQEAFRLLKVMENFFCCRTAVLLPEGLEMILPAGDSSQTEVLKRQVDGSDLAG